MNRNLFYAKIGDHYLHGYLDKGEFRNGHYVEVLPYLVDDIKDATKYDSYELKEIHKWYHKYTIEDIQVS